MKDNTIIEEKLAATQEMIAELGPELALCKALHLALSILTMATAKIAANSNEKESGEFVKSCFVAIEAGGYILAQLDPECPPSVREEGIDPALLVLTAARMLAENGSLMLSNVRTLEDLDVLDLTKANAPSTTTK